MVIDSSYCCLPWRSIPARRATAHYHATYQNEQPSQRDQRKEICIGFAFGATPPIWQPTAAVPAGATSDKGDKLHISASCKAPRCTLPSGAIQNTSMGRGTLNKPIPMAADLDLTVLYLRHPGVGIRLGLDRSIWSKQRQRYIL